MTHPSIQGLREALLQTVEAYKRAHPESSWSLVDVVLANLPAYLTEHGVLLSGEGLVRARELTREHAKFVSPPFFRLVPVPQDSEERPCRCATMHTGPCAVLPGSWLVSE